MSSPATEIDQLLVHAAWLRRFAGALLRDGDDADDLVQSTFVSAWQHPPEDGSKPRSWLARVAQNRARDMRRGERRRAVREEAATEAVGAPPPTPEQLMGDLQIHRTVAEVVTALDEPYRQTVLLRYYEGLSAADIAARLGAPAGTIRWRLKEGLDRVRRALDARCGDRNRWMLALAPLVPRAATSASAVAAASAGAAAASVASRGAAVVARSSSSLAGALVLLGAVTVLLLVAGAWWLRDDAGDREVPTAAAPAATTDPSTGPATPARTGQPPRLAARATAPAPAAGGTDPAFAEADGIVRHMLGAIASGSYDAFLLHADDTFKASIDKATILKLSADLAGPLERGFQLEPLGTLDRQGFRTFLWRLDLRGGGDQFLVNLSLEDGQVAGFWIQ